MTWTRLARQLAHSLAVESAGNRRPLMTMTANDSCGAAVGVCSSCRTLIVNLVGCFAIAAVMHAAVTLSWSPTLRSAITIG